MVLAFRKLRTSGHSRPRTPGRPVHRFHRRHARGCSRSPAATPHVPYGPPLPPPISEEEEEDLRGAYERDEKGVPLWLRDLEDDRDMDPEVDALLKNSNGEESAVRDSMNEYCEKKEDPMFRQKTGRDAKMRVVFRDYDPSGAYFWLQLYSAPSKQEIEAVEQVVLSWFTVGKLGGYNGMNLQVHQASNEDMSHLAYKQDRDDDVFVSYYHDITPVENKDTWLRFRVDLGTGDELGLDILINTLQGFSKEYIGIRQLCIGGYNDDWPTPVLGEDEKVNINSMGDEEGDDHAPGWMDDLDENDIMHELRVEDPERYEELKQLNSHIHDFGDGPK